MDASSEKKSSPKDSELEGDVETPCSHPGFWHLTGVALGAVVGFGVERAVDGRQDGSRISGLLVAVLAFWGLLLCVCRLVPESPKWVWRRLRHSSRLRFQLRVDQLALELCGPAQIVRGIDAAPFARWLRSDLDAHAPTALHEDDVAAASRRALAPKRGGFALTSYLGRARSPREEDPPELPRDGREIDERGELTSREAVSKR